MVRIACCVFLHVYKCVCVCVCVCVYLFSNYDLIFKYSDCHFQASLVAQMLKNLPEMQENRFRSRGQEDPLKKAMATHSSILVWRIPWTEEPGGLRSMGSQRVRHD